MNPDVVRAALHVREGEPLDVPRLEADLRRLYADGDFERVGYGLLNEAGRHVVLIDADEKFWQPNFLRIGLEGGADLHGESRFEFLGSLRRTWIDALGAEWRNEFQVGYEQRLSTELYQPLDLSQTYFVAPYAQLRRAPQDVYGGDQRVARYVLYDAAAGVDAGVRLGRAGEFRAGLLAGRLDQRLDLGALDLSPGPAHVREGAWRMRLNVDELDRVVAPRAGFESSATLLSSRAALGAQSNYTRWEASASAAQSLWQNTLNLGATFGGRFGSDDLPRYQVFQWGGFLHQSGYRIGSLDGQSLQFFRAIYQYRLAPLPFLNGVYAGFSLEAGRLGRPIAAASPTGTLKSGSTFLLLDSPIGPLYLAYGRSRAGDSSLYLYLGLP